MRPADNATDARTFRETGVADLSESGLERLWYAPALPGGIVSTPHHPPDEKEPREVELKLGLASAAEHARLREALDSAGGFVRAVRQENLFLDGEGGVLSDGSISVRVRVERDGGLARTTLTVKAGYVRRGEVTDRAEWECALPLGVEAVRADPSRLLGLDLPPVHALARLRPGLTALRLLGGFTNERRVYRVPLALPDAPARAVTAPGHVETVWELDRAEFPDGSVDHELEVELGGLRPAVGIEAVIAAIHAELARLGVNTVDQPKTKFARFRERNRP
jgi:hypothetical protein